MTEANTPKRRLGLAGMICFAIAAYFLATGAFALVNGEQFASATPQLLRYVVVPLGIALAFVLSALLATRETRTLVASTGLAILGGLFAFEILMTVRNYSAVAGLVALPKIEWMRDQHVDKALPPSRTPKGLNATLQVKDLSSALLGGIPNERVLLCTKDGKPIFYRADQYGFNNPASVYRDRPEIVVLGDSFVEGICLEPGEDLVGELRKSAPATIGLGSRGAGPLSELAALGRFGVHLRPRTVVMAFFEGNDWENLEGGLKEAYLRQALDPGAQFGPAAVSPATLQRARPVIASWLAHDAPGPLEVLSRTASLRNLVALSNTSLSLGIAYPKAPPEIPEYSRVLARTKQIAGSWGGEVVLLYIPQKDRYMGALKRDFVYDQMRSKVLAAAAENDVPVIDLVDLFSREPQPIDLYAPDAHFSERGAEIAANAILERLRRLPGERASKTGPSNRPKPRTVSASHSRALAAS